jgi:hypothetical protein
MPDSQIVAGVSDWLVRTGDIATHFRVDRGPRDAADQIALLQTALLAAKAEIARFTDLLVSGESLREKLSLRAALLEAEMGRGEAGIGRGEAGIVVETEE